MGSSVLFTRPRHDYPTRYLATWNDEIIERAKEKRMDVFDLEGKRAKRKNVESFLQHKQPNLVLFNGHGGPDLIMGHENEIIMRVRNKESMLAKTIVYALACASGAILGPACVKAGARAYIGYDADFTFMRLNNFRTHPQDDSLAKLFSGPSNLIGTTLIKGHTAGDAYKRSQKAFRRNINRLISSETRPEESATLRYLLWDMQHQVCLGNKEAKIVSDI